MPLWELDQQQKEQDPRKRKEDVAERQRAVDRLVLLRNQLDLENVVRDQS